MITAVAAEHVKPLGVEGVKKVVSEVEDYASRVLDEVVKEFKEKVFISYSSIGDIPATVMYWIIREVAPQVPLEMHSSDALAFHILAYRKRRIEEIQELVTDATIVAFAGPGGENQLVFLRDAAVNTGANLVAIIHRLPPVIEDRMGPQPLLVEPPGPYPLAATVFAARLAAALVEKFAEERNVRVDRVVFESLELVPAIDELVEKHGADAKRILECDKEEKCLLVYTPTLKGPARLVSRLNPKLKIVEVQEAVALIASGFRPDKLSIMYTTADEDVIREIRFKGLTMGAKLAELRLATDPVTAPIYATILFYALQM